MTEQIQIYLRRLEYTSIDLKVPWIASLKSVFIMYLELFRRKTSLDAPFSPRFFTTEAACNNPSVFSSDDKTLEIWGVQPNLKPKVSLFIFLYTSIFHRFDWLIRAWILDETLSGVCGFLFSNTQIPEENQSRTPGVGASKLKVV